MGDNTSRLTMLVYSAAELRSLQHQCVSHSLGLPSVLQNIPPYLQNCNVSTIKRQRPLTIGRRILPGRQVKIVLAGAQAYVRLY